MYTRHILPLLKEALADTPVVLLNGARQTGKSTLVQSLSAGYGRRYLTLDERVTLAAAKGDPEGFVAGLNEPVTLDEAQRAPELFLAIKAAVDRDRMPGRFLLTGSANVLLLPDIADSLAGRMEVLSLWPLSSAEIAGSPTTNLVDWLFDGPMNALSIPPCNRAQRKHPANSRTDAYQARGSVLKTWAGGHGAAHRCWRLDSARRAFAGSAWAPSR